MISTKSVQELIQELDQTDECESVEAKEISRSDVGRSVYETICAFSNEPDLGGGTVLLGVKRDEGLFPFYSASGVEDVDKVIRDVASGCSTTFNVPVRVDISSEKVGSKVVIRVDVPEVHSSQKPIFLKNLGLPRGAMRRIGSTDQHCTHDDLVAFFHNKAQEPHDTHVVSDASWADIDPDAIEAYRKARKDANPFAEELNWSNEDVLHALGAAKEVDGKLSITATGLLVFGKPQALRRVSPPHRIDYIRAPGKSWISDAENPFDAMEVRGPLIQSIGRVLTHVLSDLPKTFRVDENSGQRVEIPTIPQRVMREAIVNAVMHRNYQEYRPVQIIRYSNRVVIKNPGYSLKSEDRFDQPGSAIRNPHIAEILHETRFAEQKGSGIRVMREFMAKSGLSSPTFSSDRANDEFTATFLFHHFLGEADWVWLSHFNGYDLTEDQMRALVFVREAGAIDNSAYRGLMHVDTLTASKDLRSLKASGLLDDRGSGSRTYYVAGPALQDFLADDGSMHAKAPSIISNSPQSEHLDVEALPMGLRARVGALGKRVQPEVAETLIRDLCAWQPLSADEIARIFGKTTNYLSNKYLYKMVREGRLEYKYPKMVKHPGQKYVTPKVEGQDG